MAFLNIPVKSIQAELVGVAGTESMAWNNPLLYPVIPPATIPPAVQKDFRWRVTLNIVEQQHSSNLTRDPGTYNGQDVAVGQWIANLVSGQAWQIISIESKTSTQIIAIVQDIYRYNTFRDPAQVGNGNPGFGSYVIFSLGDVGLPEIDPVPPSGISSAFATNLASRFEYINLQYDYPLYQAGNTFSVNDVIAVDSATNSFVLSNSTHKLVIGRVTSISDTISGWFTINPVQKIVDYLDYLPGGIGDIIYSSTTEPGGVTDVPGGSQIYIKLRNNTQSVSVSGASGPTTAGSVFQVNGVDITVGGGGTAANVVAAVNSESALTGVTASLALAPTIVETDPLLISSTYGEPALAASAPFAVSSINGVTVTFDIASTEPGYEGYSRAAQMATAINNAAIPDIVASTPSALVLRITNTAGGAINISNIVPDINGVPFAGPNSGSGIQLSTPASTNSNIEFTAVDARAINFLDVNGTVLEDFGLTSVENGTKACGLYIENGLRPASSTVVSNITQLNALSPLVGDQAYVIDSDDGAGNYVDEWSMWIFDGSVWVKTATQDSSTTDAKSLKYLLTTTSPSIATIGEISTGRRITLITVEVIVPFDTAAALSVGYLVNNPTPQLPVADGLMTAGVIDLTVAGTYTTSTDVLFGTDTVSGDVTITSNFTINGATTGSAQIVVSYV